MGIRELQDALAEFAEEREWGRFHTPKNLVMALTGEVGELTEIFQWLTPEQSARVMEDAESAEAVEHEMADVFSYLLRLADVLGVDLERALVAKMELNRRKYPVELARGRAAKYDALGDGLGREGDVV
ncbi:nucleotide pyrophosphohydrolase [Allostreptomyces psammosilenae]|uniref:NTP pyrophosphatase (Non-canonical NTP hydrolase) n=1 Tax=Allostreptomyces psammosilenae TaxID=1892865 RepID=A0A853A507_9ACTN|nr:nucleotide pyrophosphohydrolase [Allostreptomyces psammosilenae]NYI05588.1 NTP pyrophosphatase (non-canonical NTP hydrolase) [Allostreptomyces psammosilenae]